MANSTTHLPTLSATQAGKETYVNGVFDAMSQGATYGRNQLTCTGLTWGYFGGNVIKTDGTMTQIANGTLTLTASTTNYIVALKSSGAVSSATATTNWNDRANYWRLYSVVTGTATVTSWTDSRESAKHSTGPFGFKDGGGAVTQATSKTTGVTLNAPCGKITMNNAALADATTVSFTLTNSFVEAGDVVALSFTTGITGSYYIPWVSGIAAGSCSINIRNISGSSQSDAIPINFVVIKGVSA